MSPARWDDGVWDEALQKWELREERGSMAAVLSGGCHAVTHRPGQLGMRRAAKQPELGTEIVAFEVNIVKATALLSPAPASAMAVTQPCPSRSNKTSPKRSTPSPGSHFGHIFNLLGTQKAQNCLSSF